jgi:Na+:H+ antiporter, NhaA family
LVCSSHSEFPLNEPNRSSGQKPQGLSPAFPREPIDALTTPLQRFLHTESSSGLILMVAALTALIVTNSDLADGFEAIWQTPIGLRIGDYGWTHSLRHWINDGLMTLFFFVVGLEIKREISVGELSNSSALAFPISAALGGMAVPALVYVLLAPPDDLSGWGVVMATDIAFVVGCLALLGKAVPTSLKIFMLALAIVDDIGAIMVIALGYSENLHVPALVGASLGIVLIVALRWLGVRSLASYWVLGLVVWAAMHESGIHPTIAGVVLGLLTPAKPWLDERRFHRFLSWARQTTVDEPTVESASRQKSVKRVVARAAIESMPPQQRLEDTLHPWSAFLVLPLFALANAGVTVAPSTAFEPLFLPIALGLFVGKPVGVFAFAWLSTALGVGRKPTDIGWGMLFAASMLGGIGFTMSLFIGNLAFDGTSLATAKFAILIGSIASGVAGMAMLRVSKFS